MKLVRFGAPGQERPGVWLEDTPAVGEQSILDVRAMVFDIEDYDAHFFSHWGIQRLESMLHERNLKTVPATSVRLGPPVARPGKILCLGKNYIDHALEFDSQVPTQPIVFSKAPTAINGPFDPIVIPSLSCEVDAEVELAMVIGRTTRNVIEASALDCVAGYTVLNDLTDRRAQREDKQWFRAKSYDTFCPIGPFLVTPDEVGNPQNLGLYSKVNDRILQNSNTSQLIFDLRRIISYISATITLEPGDIIATGTPGGIGSSQKPPVLLKAGDLVEVGVERLGEQLSTVAFGPLENC